MNGTARETLGAAMRRATRKLSAAGLEAPGRDARALLAFAAGLEPMSITLEAGRALTPEAGVAFDAAIAERIRRRPVAQIIGRREFWGRDFRVTSDVLDPRPETESIVALALAGAPARRVLDLGTGSGILAVTLAAEWPQAQVVATDISAAALAVARENAARLGVADRMAFSEGDWWQPVEGRFDLIVGNPPYIAEAEIARLSEDVRIWEPRGALTQGGDGLAAYRSIAARLARHMAPGARALFEFGVGQARDVSDIFAAAGLRCRCHRDMSGRDRVVELARAGRI